MNTFESSSSQPHQLSQSIGHKFTPTTNQLTSQTFSWLAIIYTVYLLYLRGGLLGVFLGLTVQFRDTWQIVGYISFSLKQQERFAEIKSMSRASEILSRRGEIKCPKLTWPVFLATTGKIIDRYCMWRLKKVKTTQLIGLRRRKICFIIDTSIMLNVLRIVMFHRLTVQTSFNTKKIACRASAYFGCASAHFHTYWIW